jgi:hypothetical protein
MGQARRRKLAGTAEVNCRTPRDEITLDASAAADTPIEREYEVSRKAGLSRRAPRDGNTTGRWCCGQHQSEREIRDGQSGL